jgi:hypothetical protein
LDGNTQTGASDHFLARYDSFGRLIGLEQLGVVFQNSYAPQCP